MECRKHLIFKKISPHVLVILYILIFWQNYQILNYSEYEENYYNDDILQITVFLKVTHYSDPNTSAFTEYHISLSNQESVLYHPMSVTHHSLQYTGTLGLTQSKFLQLITLSC